MVDEIEIEVGESPPGEEGKDPFLFYGEHDWRIDIFVPGPHRGRKLDFHGILLVQIIFMDRDVLTDRIESAGFRKIEIDRKSVV
jgi:hypothetical protein